MANVMRVLGCRSRSGAALAPEVFAVASRHALAEVKEIPVGRMGSVDLLRRQPPAGRPADHRRSADPRHVVRGAHVQRAHGRGRPAAPVGPGRGIRPHPARGHLAGPREGAHRRPRPPLRGGHREVARPRGRGHRPRGQALARAGLPAGDQPGHQGRRAPARPHVAPRRALGPRRPRRRACAAAAHPRGARQAGRRTAPVGHDGADRPFQARLRRAHADRLAAARRARRAARRPDERQRSNPSAA